MTHDTNNGSITLLHMWFWKNFVLMDISFGRGHGDLDFKIFPYIIVKVNSFVPIWPLFWLGFKVGTTKEKNEDTSNKVVSTLFELFILPNSFSS